MLDKPVYGQDFGLEDGFRMDDLITPDYVIRDGEIYYRIRK